MVNLGIPVPPGFTITTEVCTYFYQHQMQLPEGLTDQVLASLKRVEKLMDMQFGDPKNPLLLSIRSGARASMPGMMDTVLNLGLNAKTVKGTRRADGERMVRLGLLPPLRRDVRRRGARAQAGEQGRGRPL